MGKQQITFHNSCIAFLLVPLVGICIPTAAFAACASAGCNAPNSACDNKKACVVENRCKDKSIRVTVRVHWKQGSDQGNVDKVLDLGPGETQYVACAYQKPGVTSYALYHTIGVKGEEVLSKRK